jgi:hypothetical protein
MFKRVLMNFTKNYLSELNKYCLSYNKVYQVFDNHVDGKTQTRTTYMIIIQI